ncbi:MAG: EpsG family protein [Clostridium sp.]|uniref:EpsG family protein n=1 Tax=Clostridium sp. TaxID=1506 RepID=UPI003F40090B
MMESYIFYSVILLTSTLSAYIAQYIPKKHNLFKILFLLVSFFILFIFSAKRYGIGTDYKLYHDMYYEIANIGNLKQAIISFNYVEPGWVIFNYIVKNIFDNVNYIFSISSFVTIGLVYLFLYKVKDKVNMGLGVFLFITLYYNQSYNLIRQFLAMSICLFGYKYIERRNLKKFIITIIIACCFHFSAIIFLPIYLLVDKLDKIKFIRFYLFATLFLGMIFYNKILYFVIKITGLTKYSVYYTNGVNVSFADIVLKFTIVFFIVINLKKLKKEDVFIYKLSTVYFIGVILSFTSFFAPFIGRISYYFEMSLILIIPRIIKLYSKEEKPIIYYCITIFFYVYYFYFYMYLNYGQTNPYTLLH